jgi:predicted permease
MSTLLQDIRYGGRMLAKSPGVTAAAALSLALGIGANTTIFSWIKGTLLMPLPGVRNQTEVVEIIDHSQAGTPNSISYPDFRDIRARGDVFDGVLAHSSRWASLNTGEAGREAERVLALLVSGNYFDVLGVKPILGRTFLPEEDEALGRNPVAVISYGLWQRRFAGDPSIVGRTVKLNGHPFTVIGVTPEPFMGTQVMLSVALFVPIMMEQQIVPGDSRLEIRGSHWLQVMARPKRGVAQEQVNAALRTLSSQLALEYPNTNEGRLLEAVPLYRSPFGPQPILGPVLLILMAVVALVLLIACANVANLLLARALARRREIAIRLSLGASRRRLLCQLLTESVLLALVGGAAGLVVGVWSVPLLMSFAPPTDMPIRLAAEMDTTLLAFTLAVSLATGVLFGLAPALQAASPNLVASIKDDGASVASGHARSRLRDTLVAAQVALSLVLLVGAGLFMRSLARAQVADPGFETSDILLASIDLFPNGYTEATGRQFQEHLVERLAALPRVRSVALSRRVPLAFGGSSSSGVSIDGYTPASNEEMSVTFNSVGSRYFETMGIPIVAGREFSPADRPEDRPVIVVNDTMATRYWRGQDPVGKLVRIGQTAREVVGVVKDIKYEFLGEDPRPYMYLPLTQVYRADTIIHVRADDDPGPLAAAMRDTVRAMDPELPVFDMKTMSLHMGFGTLTQRMAATLLSLFGSLALFLAAVGLYGVLAYAVGQRTREIGVRMALGAKGTDIFRLVLSRGLTMVVAGMGVGLVFAGMGAQLLRTQLFGVEPTDLVTYLGTAGIFMAVALLACYLPARRAMRIDPVIALRVE